MLNYKDFIEILENKQIIKKISDFPFKIVNVEKKDNPFLGKGGFGCVLNVQGSDQGNFLALKL